MRKDSSTEKTDWSTGADVPGPRRLQAGQRHARPRGRRSGFAGNRGTDHAGIATQTVVEKMLLRQKGQTRHDLGREAFLDIVYEWVGTYSHKIRDQLMRIGSSVDWTRKRFTLDDGMSKAVKEAFVTFHEKGLIYRENRLVNWC